MIQFKLENGFKLDLEKSEKVFTPTGTTEAIIEAILENNNQKKNILDLGCGCGVIGLSLFKNGLVKEPLYASDISEKAIENVKINAKLNRLSNIIGSVIIHPDSVTCSFIFLLEAEP